MKDLLINKKEYFTKIYRENVNHLFRFVFSKTYDRTVSEEIVSDTFFTLLDQLDSLDESKGNIRTYIFGIALNKLRQKWSKEKTVKNLSLDEDIYIEINSKPTKKRKDLFEKVSKILNIIPMKYKAVIMMRFVENKSIKEVANELNLSVTNVTTIQNRGLQKIKKIINEQ